MSRLMEGKKGVVLGVANRRSIAWGITEALHNAGAQLALTYQGERLENNVRSLAESLDNPLILPCDVSKDTDIDRLFSDLKDAFGTIDFLVHCIAFAPREALDGQFVDTSREAFTVAHDISAYSLVALARGAAPLMSDGGSIVALTYYGSEKVTPGYNVMGVAKASLESTVRYAAHDLGSKNIRVNAISAGPVNTLAARGVAGFTDMLKIHRERAPLGRNITTEEVGQTALFLLSNMGSGVTGSVLFVDSGYHIMGM